jgi:hypothetical protein
MFTKRVNATFINALFTAERIPGMHDSLQRLYEAAREATGHLPLGQRVESGKPSELARALNVSPAIVTNWKARGVSIAGALDAEGRFGCSAWWILKGEHPPGWLGRGEKPPLSAEVLRRLARDSRAATMWENAIRAGMDMPPFRADLGNRDAA